MCYQRCQCFLFHHYLGNEDHGKLVIEIQYFRLEIDDIVDVDNIILIQFGIWSVWKDSRVTFINLNKDEETFIHEKEKNNIWIPQYTIWKANKDGMKEDFRPDHQIDKAIFNQILQDFLR